MGPDLPQPKIPIEWVAGTPASGPLERLDFALRTGGEERPAFVPVSESGRFSRVLLARFATGTTALCHVALKLPRDNYRPGGRGLASGQVDNREIESMWHRERANLLAARSPHVIQLFDLGEGKTTVGPLAFCLHTRRFFQPLCLETLTVLELCRDDELLIEHGLEPYSTSCERYLYSRAGVAQAHRTQPTFYTSAKTSGSGVRGAVVRRGMAVFSDAERAMAGLSEEAKRTLAQRFPDWWAVYSEPTPVDQRVVPLTYYGGPVLVTALGAVRYDQLCDLLGGAPAEVAVPVDPEQPNPEVVRLATSLATGTQWFFAPEGGRRWALEVLLLKVMAFTQVCRGLLAHHRSNAAAHFALEPRNITADLVCPHASVPRRWQFSVSLLDLGAQHRLRLPGMPGDLPEFLLPALDLDPAYESALLRPSEFGRDFELRLAVASGAPTAEGLILAHHGVDSRLDAVSVGDLVRLMPHGQTSTMGDGPLYGLVTARTGQHTEITVRAAALGGLPTALSASVAVFPRIGPPVDLAALGMLLLRTLVVHDSQDLGAVRQVAQRVLMELDITFNGPNATELPTTVLRRRLALEEATLGQVNVVWSAALRGKLGPFVDPGLWQSLMISAFRLLATSGPLAMCTRPCRPIGEEPGALMSDLVAEFERLIDCLHVELFGAEDRRLEIGALCDELRDQISAVIVGHPGEGQPA